MKRLFVALCASFIGLGMFSLDAEAKRLGGGSSFGMQRSSPAMQRSPAPTSPAQQAIPAKPAATPQAPAPQPSGMSRWLGPIAGIAAGLGLAALMSHLGMGEGMGSILLILALVAGAVFLFRMLGRKRQPDAAMQYAGAGAPAQFEPVSAPPGGAAGAMAASAAAPAVNVPAGFDVEGFLRQAKVNFVRLQAANDAGNIEDIRQFTTPEMYAEIKLELGDRGGKAQTTDVMQVNANLLELVTEGSRYVASVRFSGQIREEADAAPEAFDEVWHLTKPVDGSSGWVIAGIQQFQ